MCKFWRLEKCNHHFPELLKKKRDFSGLTKRFLSPANSLTVLVSLTLVLGLAYLVQTNINATKGYQIKDLENELAKLQEDNRDLRLSYVQSQSMSNIINKSTNYNLVPIGNVETVTPLGSAVALR